MIYSLCTCLEEINQQLQVSKQLAPSGRSAALPQPLSEGSVIDADKYFLPFELACKSQVPRIVNTALDIIQVQPAQ